MSGQSAAGSFHTPRAHGSLSSWWTRIAIGALLLGATIPLVQAALLTEALGEHRQVFALDRDVVRDLRGEALQGEPLQREAFDIPAVGGGHERDRAVRDAR